MEENQNPKQEMIPAAQLPVAEKSRPPTDLYPYPYKVKNNCLYMQDEQLRMFRQEKQEMLRSIQNSLRQDGSEREKNSSELSKMLSDSLRAMETVASEVDRKLKKLLITTSVASMLLSVLVCAVWHLLVG